MARRKKRRGGRRLGVGKYVNLAFKVLGAFVAAGPAIRGASENLRDPQRIPGAVLYYYSGVSQDTGTWNPTVATQGIVSVAGGLFLAKLGGWIARRF